MRKYEKKDFGTAQMLEIKPGEKVQVICRNFAEVASLRSGAVQFIKMKQPEGITRFSTVAKACGDGNYEVEMEAVTE